jgi:hypothetical protein
MIVTEPHFDWQWCVHQGQLCLKTAQGIHRTPVLCRSDLPQSDFTLGQAELYWQSLFALESLHWPAEAVFAASVDAVAQLEFAVADAHKSFYLQHSQCQQHQVPFVPAPFNVVHLCGRNQALALVLDATTTQCRLMLLSDLETLTGRILAAGHSFSSLHDRLSLYHPPQTPWRKSA